MQANTQIELSPPRMATLRAEKRREQEVQRLIKDLEVEMQRLVDVLVKKSS